MKFRNLSMLGLCWLGMTACKFDEKETKWQYTPDMADAPTVKAQESYIDPPEGSVPLTAILYPSTTAESEKLLQSPIAKVGGNRKQELLAKGEVNYKRFCTPCHGAVGKGDGTVSKYFGQVPDITSEAYANKGDGHFFHYITFGGGIMPSYGHAISAHERWEIILHLRELQKAEK